MALKLQTGGVNNTDYLSSSWSMFLIFIIILSHVSCIHVLLVCLPCFLVQFHFVIFPSLAWLVWPLILVPPVSGFPLLNLYQFVCLISFVCICSRVVLPVTLLPCVTCTSVFWVSVSGSPTNSRGAGGSFLLSALITSLILNLIHIRWVLWITLHGMNLFPHSVLFISYATF